jgi:surface carbohydrate biosynthesis protein
MLEETKKRKIWLYLPIETKSREFHAKILLACFAANQGFNVVIGHKSKIRQQLSFLPRGFVLNLGISENSVKYINILNNKGFDVIAMDEEGLVFYSPDFYSRYRVSEKTLQKIKLFFAWGKNQADCILTKYPFIKEKIIVAGNSRFDLLRPEFITIFKKDADKIRCTRGPFILINTNFAYNHYDSVEQYKHSLKEMVSFWTKEDETFYSGIIKYSSSIFNNFCTMIKSVSQSFPDYTLIVRPHPSENLDTWKERMKDCPNVRICQEGNVIPWILASDLVIHNNCTTGIEATVINTPTIAYCPQISSTYDLFLPNAMSYKIENIEDLLYTIKKMKVSGPDFIIEHGKKMKKELLFEYISGLDDKYASEKMIESLITISPQTSSPWDSLTAGILIPLNKIVSRGRKEISNLRQSQDRGSKNLVQQKYPGTNVSEIQNVITEFQESSGRFSDITAKELGTDTFIITQQ